MKLSESLRRVRTQSKITQTQAAQAAGVSPAMYQFYEYGRNEPPASVLVALADLSDLSLDYLVGRSDDPARH